MSLWLSENRVRTLSSHLWDSPFPFFLHDVRGFFTFPGFAILILTVILITYKNSSLTTEYGEAQNGELRKMLRLKLLSAII